MLLNREKVLLRLASHDAERSSEGQDSAMGVVTVLPWLLILGVRSRSVSVQFMSPLLGSI